MTKNEIKLVKEIDLIHIRDLKEILCLAILIDIADQAGVIRKTIADLTIEFSARNIFCGKQSRIFVHKVLNNLEKKEILIRKQRCKPDAQNQICGKHFYFQINFKNKDVLIQNIDLIPRIPSAGELRSKISNFTNITQAGENE